MRASVKSQISFSLATPADDPAIRRLLRDNPMPGAIFLSLEREPNYFADAHQPSETKQTIVARKSARIVCVGNCTTRLRFLNGQPRRVAYLGGLRLDACVAGRFDILRRGYEFFRELQAAAPADFYFTSIAADNLRARSFLERNLRGMPRYEFHREFVTLVLPTQRRSPTRREPECWKRARPEICAPKRATVLNESNQHFQLAPHWTAEQLESLAKLGLRSEDFFSQIETNGQLTAALWDQCSFKQTVIRGYVPWLALVRPAINLFARFSGKPGLPAVGTTLSNAFVSHIGLSADASGDLVQLLQDLTLRAGQRGIEWLTLGFAANDPRLQVVRRHFRCWEYRSRLYVVRWPDFGGVGTELDGRLLAPEVATL